MARLDTRDVYYLRVKELVRITCSELQHTRNYFNEELGGLRVDLHITQRVLRFGLRPSLGRHE